jgi:hypothetical protein
VMTKWAHLKRGYCCGNGCKHCAYWNENVHHAIWCTDKINGKTLQPYLLI